MKSITLTLFCLLLSYSAFAAETNAPITVTAPAKFKQHGEWLHLIVDDGRHNFDIVWSMQRYNGLVTLRSNQVYTFTIFQEEKFTPPIKIPMVVRVVEGGKVIYDREVCEVHLRKMEHKEVPIEYGYFRRNPDAPSDDTEQQLFPHRLEVKGGGCAISDDSPKTANVYVCSECMKAYEKWKAEHQQTK